LLGLGGFGHRDGQRFSKIRETNSAGGPAGIGSTLWVLAAGLGGKGLAVFRTSRLGAVE